MATPDKPAKADTAPLPGDFLLVRRSPPPDLEGLVVDIAGFRQRNDNPLLQVEAAALVVPLIISFGDPFDIALGRQPEGEERLGSFAAGLCSLPAFIVSRGTTRCVQVNFTPPGARRFFGMPMDALADRLVDLDDFEDPELRELRRKLGESGDWDERLDMLVAYIRRRLLCGGPMADATGWAYRRIVASAGRVPIAPLAEEIGWSRKNLAARFRQEIGLTPKAVARIARFNRAQSLAKAATENGWADVAAACGYADQAHMVREFREFSGSTPSAWLSAVPADREVTFLQ